MEEDVKAATLSPGEIKIEEFPYPELKEDGMIVKMEMSGLCGSDIHMFERGFTSRMFTLDFPIVPGHENVGVIEEMGAKAQDSMHLIAGEALEVGDRVTWVPVLACGQCYYCSHVYLPQFCHNGFFYGFHPVGEPATVNGGFSEYLYIRPNTHIVKVPKNVSTEAATLLEPFSVGLKAIERALQVVSVQEKEGTNFGNNTIFVQGAGPIAMSALIATRLIGQDNTIIVTDLKEHRLKMAKKFGADVTLNVSETSVEERQKEILDLTGGEGVDIVLSCSGLNSDEVVSEGIDLAKKGGVFMEIGNFVPGGKNADIDLFEICFRELLVLGNFGFNNRNFEKSFNMIETLEKLNLGDMVTDSFKIENASKAMEHAVELGGVKTVITP